MSYAHKASHSTLAALSLLVANEQKIQINYIYTFIKAHIFSF